MKCVKLLQTGEVYRVSDTMARITVEVGQAVYVPKKIWKETGKKTTKSLYTDVNTEISDKHYKNQKEN